MSDKPWKAFERWVAKALGTNRVPVLGKLDADVVGQGLWIDCKLRAEVPNQYFDLVYAAELFGYDTVTIFGPDNLVPYQIMRFRTLVEKDPAVAGIISKREVSQNPVEWLAHIALSCPDDHIPCVVMSKPRQNYRDAIVILHFGAYTDWVSQNCAVGNLVEKEEAVYG